MDIVYKVELTKQGVNKMSQLIDYKEELLELSRKLTELSNHELDIKVVENVGLYDFTKVYFVKYKDDSGVLPSHIWEDRYIYPYRDDNYDPISDEQLPDKLGVGYTLHSALVNLALDIKTDQLSFSN